MPVIENLNPILVVAGITGILALYYFFSTLTKLKSLKLIGAVGRLFSFTFFSSITIMLSFLIIGTYGYQGLSKEVPAATIKITPIGIQKFQVKMTFSDSSYQTFSLEGDELLVDAYILKWKPWTNILGLHTAYRLERVSGRYKKMLDEQIKNRTVLAINKDAGKGIAQWRTKYDALSFALDVEHGSASFIDAHQSAEYQLMVTTDGLLIRPIEK